MKELSTQTDQERIDAARLAVDTYKKFKAKYPRATNYINAYLRWEEYFPPMAIGDSPRAWIKYKKWVELLHEWMQKDGTRDFERIEIRNVCIVVLKMALDDEEKREKETRVKLTRDEILSNLYVRRGEEQKPTS